MHWETRPVTQCPIYFIDASPKCLIGSLHSPNSLHLFFHMYSDTACRCVSRVVGSLLVVRLANHLRWWCIASKKGCKSVLFIAA